MRFFAYGPLAAGVITIREVLPVGTAADARAAGTGEGRADITDAVGTGDPLQYLGGTWTVATSTLATPAALTTLATRRRAIKGKLRELEGVPLGTWGGASQGRARAYSRWLRMITHAAAVDANLTDDDRHFVLDLEASHDGRTWYWLEKLNGSAGDGANWGPVLAVGNDGDWTPSTWYSTVNPAAEVAAGRSTSTVPNTRGYVSANQIRAGVLIELTPLPANFDWAGWLATED